MYSIINTIWMHSGSGGPLTSHPKLSKPQILPLLWEDLAFYVLYEPQNTRKMLLAVTSRNSRIERCVLLWRWHSPALLHRHICHQQPRWLAKSLWHFIDKWTIVAYTRVFESLCLFMPFFRVAIISQTGRGHALTKLDRLLSPGRDRATIIKFQRDQLQTALFRWIWPCQDTIGDNKFWEFWPLTAHCVHKHWQTLQPFHYFFVWKLWNKLGPGLINSLPLNSAFWKASWSSPGSKAQILAIALAMEQLFAEIIEIVVLQSGLLTFDYASSPSACSAAISKRSSASSGLHTWQIAESGCVCVCWFYR